MPNEFETVLRKLSKRVKELRLKKGLTQEKIAYENDISKGNYSDIENGIGNPSLKTLLKIANSLEISLSELFK
jgi:transcriptional regulator with XRE-family HTH domain